MSARLSWPDSVITSGANQYGVPYKKGRMTMRAKVINNKDRALFFLILRKREYKSDIEYQNKSEVCISWDSLSLLTRKGYNVTKNQIADMDETCLQIYVDVQSLFSSWSMLR